MQPRLKFHRAANSLLEMIVACSIFLTVAVALMTVWAQHSRQMNLSGSRLVAQHVAQSVMDTCIGAGFAGVDNYNGPRPQVQLIQTIRGTQETVTFDVTVTVIPRSQWKVVTVVVQWNDSVGRSQVQMKTQLAPQV